MPKGAGLSIFSSWAHRATTAVLAATLVSVALSDVANAAASTKTASGVTCTIVGTAGADRLSGTPGKDVICGLGGNDVINGAAGDDVVDGGSGNDSVNGGDGNDTLEGSAGNDVILGGSGTDTLTGGAGNDILDGGAGNDSVSGGDGGDLLLGSQGDDKLTGDAGNDAIDGFSGNDTESGGTGNDTLLGYSGNDSLSGDAGSDTEFGGLGNDKLNGGTGTDTLDFSSNNSGVSIDLNAGTSTGDGSDSITQNENVIGGSGNDSISGDSSANTITGGAGNDSISGGPGNDTLLGNNGNDAISGGDGNDTESGGDGNDRLLGDTGNDALRGDTGNDGLIGGPGTDLLAGANGQPAAGEKNLCEKDANDTVTYCGFDNAAPWIASVDFSRTSVDSSKSAQTVIATLHVTDELMGTNYITCSLLLEGARLVTGIDQAVLKSGDTLDGTYTCNLTIPLGGTPGRYGLALEAVDKAGNRGLAQQVAGQKWHSNLPEIIDQNPELWIQQIGAGDIDSPRITDVVFDPTQIDTSKGPASFGVQMKVTDDVSGVDSVRCGLRHNAVENMDIVNTVRQLSGDTKSGVWRCDFTLPKNSGHGKWSVGIFAFDKTGKLYSIQGVPTSDNDWAVDDTAVAYAKPNITLGANSITQTGAGDDELPVMNSISLDRASVNTSSSDQTVVATLNLTDVQSGIRSVEFRSFSPTTFAQNVAFCTQSSKDGKGNETWSCSLKLPIGSQKGLHTVSVMMYDKVGNRVTYQVNEQTQLWRMMPLAFYNPTIVENLNLGPIGILNTDQ